MSLMNRLASAAAAAALIATPTLAAAAPNRAASLSVAKSPRAATLTASKSKIAEGSTATFVSIGILAALVVGVLVLTGSDDDNADSN